MRFLIDNALPSRLADLLKLAGHDAVHARDYGMQAATDALVLTRAIEEERVVVSADTDFGALLVAQQASRPSFILFRNTDLLRAEDYAGVLLPSLPLLEPELVNGCVAVFRSGHLRVRRLPISLG